MTQKVLQDCAQVKMFKRLMKIRKTFKILLVFKIFLGSIPKNIQEGNLYGVVIS
jgi:hypothetical protein